ncbi:fibronectin type III domain-containing protein [Ruania alba]|uniref:Conserved repeat domain-containing protein n=1 Tax=Ruania alba TaxID=648782 RepID=A0A1H5N5Q7_9MICO|nr:DUF11 domain-containing protein [Ruania alba]SEE96800.1 conserved repeat domain-containing protein [Ruania alba]
MSRRTMQFAVTALTTFTVLGLLTPTAALWNVDATIAGDVRVGDVSGCGRQGLANGGFESPEVGDGSWSHTTPTSWTWTDASGNTIPGEIWNTPYPSNYTRYAPHGEQLIELNSTTRGTISQTIETTPGETLGWSFYHRGHSWTETVRVSIGVPGSMVSQGDYYSNNTSRKWLVHSGAYVVPPGQTSTTISIRSISGNNHDAGNLMDAVAFGVGPCLDSSSTVTEVGGTSGSYVPGDRVRYATTITNTGDAPGVGTSYAYTLPPSLELVPGTLEITDPEKDDQTGASTATYDSATREITAPIGDRPLNQIPAGRIFPDSTITVTFDATIQSSAAGSTIDYQPQVSTASQLAPDWSIDADPTNAPIEVEASSPPMEESSGQVDSEASNADLSVSALTTPLNATAGRTATWTFRGTNNGPDPATDSSATLSIPSELTDVHVQYSTSNDAGTSPVECTLDGSSATCPLGDIPSGETRRFWVSGTIPSSFTAEEDPRTMTVDAALSGTTADTGSNNNSLAYDATVSMAPTTPSDLRTNGQVTSTDVPLTWDPSTAASGIDGYQIRRNGTTEVGTVNGTATSYTVTGTPEGDHSFQVRAVDDGGRFSEWSHQVNVTVP